MSRQDKQALNIYEESARLVDGHYQIAIPWKCHPPDLPNNKPLAEHRLNLLRKKLLKDPELYSRYSAFMTDLLDNGYAKKVLENLRDRNNGKVWYLPHHSVVHLQKPDKVRVAFDCAATYRGASCYKPKEFRTIADVQVHHFSGASEIGYGAVSYLRFIVHCSFVMCKTRLAPVKSLSVPHLEFTAATLVVKLDKMLRKELFRVLDR